MIKGLLLLPKIIATTVAAAIFYGVLHDLITAHICIEYFSVAHPMLIPVFNDDPIILAIEWGILSTWWFGLIWGFLLWATLTYKGESFLALRPFCSLLIKNILLIGVTASASGAVGFLLAKAHVFSIPVIWTEDIPADKAPRFFYAAFSHGTSYLVAAILACKIWISLIKWRRGQPFPWSRLAE